MDTAKKLTTTVMSPDGQTKTQETSVISEHTLNVIINEQPIPGTVYFDDGLDHLSDFYGNKERRYFVVEDETGSVIGGIGFASFEPMMDTAELQKLYLADSAKGSGLSYELIEFIEDKMREAGYKQSYLETHDNLQAAIHIYGKCAYKEIERPKEVVHSTMNRFFLKTL